jgi:hypothetical protein
MVQPISYETRMLLDAADRAIERSRMVVEETRQLHLACRRELRVQDARFAALRATRKQLSAEI